jgi:hypothetical protein
VVLRAATSSEHLGRSVICHRKSQEIDMPLFYFDSRTGDAILTDPEGEELPTLAAAREGGANRSS